MLRPLHSNSQKDPLIRNLPIHAEGLLLRLVTRADIGLLSEWPPYPWPHEVFRFSFSGQTADDLDRVYDERLRDDCRITLVVDAAETPVIGYIALVEVDWVKGNAGNMSFRIHPDFCDQGIGSIVMSKVRDWWFGHGMNSLRLDVAATNHRAVRCYASAGFQRAGWFWREAHDLVGKDLSEQKYLFLGDHVNCNAAIPRIRFYWMEAKIAI